MLTNKKVLFLSLFLLFSGKILATHIVGGGMTYEYLGETANGKRFRFTMKVYRDCKNGQANFDDPANIAIYRGTTQSNTLYQTFGADITSVNDITVTQPDCINFLPEICLQEGVYVFERVLPTSTQSYFVVYQRCCRTNAITNILNPNATGATYAVEITPTAFQLNNSSPVFNTFPPAVICNHYPIEVDYSVTDTDGDQLVYSFCAPYAGGGQFGGGCNNPAPNPPCPPPFTPVDFAAPYTAGAPMGGNPVVQINPQTGVISGTPQLLGQYVVGVCVEEYRNGVLLSVTRRDFQFNVTPCAPQVTALIDYDELAGPNQYIIRKCDGSTNVTIDNQSISSDTLIFEWIFDLNNGTVIHDSTNFDLNLTFPGPGTYNGLLVLNGGLKCGDTAFIQVQLYPPSTLHLGPDILVCKDSTIQFDAGSGFASFLWQNGSTAQTFSATTSGTYLVAATNACGDILRDTVKVTLSPVAAIQLSNVSLCPGKSITLNVPGFSQYTWSPAAGLSCTDCPTVTVQPSASTNYTLSAVNQDGCGAQGSFQATVLPTPMITRTIKFYSNQSVTLGNQTYTQPGTVVLNVPSTTGGCDSLNTYILELLPTTLNLQCPPDMTVAMPNNAATTVVNYGLPTTSTNCPGAQPAVQLQQGLVSGGHFPAGLNTVCYQANNTCGDTKSCCFTVRVTTLDIQCPPGQVVQLPVATTTIPVSYAAPTTTSDCPGSPVTLTLLQGLPSGGAFAAGLNKVCYEASNTCGNRDTCCFNIRVSDAPAACDIKTLGCMRYELLDIRLDSIKQPRFRIRATNFCDSELDYVAIELPPGIVGVTPQNNTIFTAPNTGNQYLVRNPNASPFYSTRYRSTGIGIKNGAADVFEQRLPQQSFPNNYIHIIGKLKNGQSFEAYLNTFNCPVQPWSGSKEDGFEAPAEARSMETNWSIRPNPTDGQLFVDLSHWKDQSVMIQVLNAQGQMVLNQNYDSGTDWLELNLNPALANGLYYLVAQAASGEKVATRFVLAR